MKSYIKGQKDVAEAIVAMEGALHASRFTRKSHKRGASPSLAAATMRSEASLPPAMFRAEGPNSSSASAPATNMCLCHRKFLSGAG
mmetsp:Transcript_6894/g.20667  ORF Transcript_6894/g.20667 Transcript_6894/m.20667 type:complete len:86 (-) Transcript_6894:1541-1798(-)